MSALPRRAALGVLTVASVFALTACQGGTGRIVGADGSCQRVDVAATGHGVAPTVLVAPCATPAPTPAPTTAPAPTTTAPPPTTAPPTTTSAPPTTAPPTAPPTTAPPTTAPPTTAPPTTAPPTTPPPVTGSAAARFGWGAPIADSSDEFNGTAIDTGKWGLPGECWPANSTVVAGRCASHDRVGGGFLRETGTADGKTGYLTATHGRRYGRYEARMRITTAAPGGQFHPNLLLWPDSDAWPSGGEYDYVEVGSGDDALTAFMHHPTRSGVVQDAYHSGPVDLGAWHDYAFEWTPAGLTGYLDGAVWFHDTDPGAQAPGPMHPTIQLDNFDSTRGMATVYMDVDWFHAYPVS